MIELIEAISSIQALIDDTQYRMDEWKSSILYKDQAYKDHLERLQHMKSGMEASRDIVKLLLNEKV